jgi:hypothetical protein
MLVLAPPRGIAAAVSVAIAARAAERLSIP